MPPHEELAEETVRENVKRLKKIDVFETKRYASVAKY